MSELNQRIIKWNKPIKRINNRVRNKKRKRSISSEESDYRYERAIIIE